MKKRGIEINRRSTVFWSDMDRVNIINLPITTSETISGKKIVENIDIVAASYLATITADTLIKKLETSFPTAVNYLKNALKEKAYILKADAVIGFTVQAIPSDRSDGEIMVTAYGTAVKTAEPDD